MEIFYQPETFWRKFQTFIGANWWEGVVALGIVHMTLEASLDQSDSFASVYDDEGVKAMKVPMSRIV